VDIPHGLIPAIAAVAAAWLLLRGNWLNPATAFALPWLCMVAVSPFEISDYSVPLGSSTMSLIILMVLAGGFGNLVAGSLVAQRSVPTEPDWQPLSERSTVFAMLLLLGAYGATTAYEGYLPLLRMLMGQDSGYKDFGLPSFHGLLLAFQNALALNAYVGIRTRGSRWYKWALAIAIALHVATVTRQNVLLLLVELAVCHAAMNGLRLNKFRLAVIGCVALAAFAIVGYYRAGDVMTIAKIKDEYTYLPAPLIWLYFYSYLSTTILDSAVALIREPVWSLNFLATLLPSFLRGDAGTLNMLDFYMESSVTTYLTPLYIDVGRLGAWLYTFVMVGLSACAYHVLARRRASVEAMLTYVVLYFCALMSFFVDQWLYLPVIFQIPCIFFLRLLSNSMPPRRDGETRAVSADLSGMPQAHSTSLPDRPTYSG
jgi:oligosaccharide repeat unit polymerase